MDRNDWFKAKWLWLRRLGMVSIAGLLAIVAGFVLGLPAVSAIGALLVMPLLFWVALIPALHWKDRYVGNRSDIWGAFLVLETSSWSKIIYWFRHVLPDWRSTGRYRDAL